MTTYFSVSTLSELAPLEVHHLYKLRTDVFVAEQATPYAEIDDVDAHPDTRHMLMWRNGDTPKRLIGTARVYPSTIDGQDFAQLGRLVIAKDKRGTGQARELLFQALRLASETYPGRDVYLTAQLPLVDYYAGYGFAPAGETYDDSGVEHQPMVLPADKLAEFIASKK